jgi:hypothetical protein
MPDPPLEPQKKPLFERNVQPGVNETLKKEGIGYRVKGIGYREKQMADSRHPTADSKKANLYCRL